MTQRTTIVGVFHDQTQARQAIAELKRAGFRDDEIGMTVRGEPAGRDVRQPRQGAGDETHAPEGGAAGLAAGAGLGALWGLGVVAIGLPAVGPAIAGGALAAVLSSAVAGAAAAGIGGALIGLGIPKDEAEYYESEFQAGRTLVTVKTTTRQDDARVIIRRHGGYDMATRPGGDRGAADIATGEESHGESVLRKDTPHPGTVSVAGTHAGLPMRSSDVPAESSAVGHRAGLGAEAGGSALPVDVPPADDELRTPPGSTGSGSRPRQSSKTSKRPRQA